MSKNILKCLPYVFHLSLTLNVLLCFSYAAAFWLWSQWEEQTQVHGPVHVSTSWHDWHGGSCEYLLLKIIFHRWLFRHKYFQREMLLGFLRWHRKYDQFTYSRDKTRWQMYHKNGLVLCWFNSCLINCYQRHSERICIVIFILNYHLSSWHLWLCFSEGLKSHWGSARNFPV